MRLFDLHCDTIEESEKRGEDYPNCTVQSSLRGRDKFQKAVQVMAVFVPDDTREQEAVQSVLDYHQYMDDQVRKVGGQTELVEKITGLDRILDEEKRAFIRSTESGAALNGDLDNINRFAGLNFEILGLVWSGADELGSGPSNDTRLTAFGKKVMERMKQVGIIVGCSHLNDAESKDLLNIAGRPSMASYSNIKVCYGHPRNFTDIQSKELVYRGELCDLNLFSWFTDDDNNGSKDYLLRYIYRMLKLDGEDVTAWGRDMGGEITCDPGLSTSYGMGRLADYLAGRDIREATVQKISFNNAYRFFKK